ILMAGRLADSVYWFDYKLPGFISSTYYRYDPALFTFNDGVKGYIPASGKWKLAPYIPKSDLARVTFDPPEAWALKNTRYGGTFDHPIADIRGLTYSPYGHDLVLDFAMRIITTEKLGTREQPDVLFVGLSSTDYLGHYYGPDSMEAADNIARMDRSLEAFFDALDRRFGGRVVVALTADHGVQPNPEIVKLRDPNADVGRIDLRNPAPEARTIAELPPARIDIERAVAKKLGVRFSADASLNDAIVRFFEEPALYVNWRRADALKLDRERVKLALRDVLRAMKTSGVDDVWTNTQLLAANPSASEAETLMRASFRADRAGDVVIALRPGWMWTWGNNSTTHGQPVENDRHVPLLFWGAGIKPGRYETAASPMDLSATIGALRDVRAGGREAHVLPCVP
ncbi:MAG TPA: alkaline phosphatase family protein, partial [Thermoanaerobaculia bacterium]|nr:alkaline phosphatase family protein [Thermoanaerobaculia bacterium]